MIERKYKDRQRNKIKMSGNIDVKTARNKFHGRVPMATEQIDLTKDPKDVVEGMLESPTTVDDAVTLSYTEGTAGEEDIRTTVVIDGDEEDCIHDDGNTSGRKMDKFRKRMIDNLYKVADFATREEAQAAYEKVSDEAVRKFWDWLEHSEATGEKSFTEVATFPRRKN